MLFVEIRNTSRRSTMKLRQNCYFQTVTRMNADLELHFGMANADLPSEVLEKRIMSGEHALCEWSILQHIGYLKGGGTRGHPNKWPRRTGRQSCSISDT